MIVTRESGPSDASSRGRRAAACRAWAGSRAARREGQQQEGRVLARSALPSAWELRWKKNDALGGRSSDRVTATTPGIARRRSSNGVAEGGDRGVRRVRAAVRVDLEQVSGRPARSRGRRAAAAEARREQARAGEQRHGERDLHDHEAARARGAARASSFRRPSWTSWTGGTRSGSPRAPAAGRTPARPRPSRRNRTPGRARPRPGDARRTR